MNEQKFYILVTNIDPAVSVEALTTFFSFTGNVLEVRLSDAEDGTKTAIVSFDSEESVKTAELMTGATLENRRINIVQTEAPKENPNEKVYSGENLPQRTIPELPKDHTKTSVAASLLAQGYILASDTFQKAVQFDKEHNISATLKAGAEKVKEKVIEVDEKLHVTEYLALGATYVNSIITGIDEKYKISQTVGEAVSTATQKVDETLHISEGVQICKEAINNGVEKVKNSDAVISMRNSTQNFKQNVQQEINQRRGNEGEEKKMEEEKNGEVPFEVNDDPNMEIVIENEVKMDTTPNEFDVPPSDDKDNIIYIDNNSN